MHHTAIAANRLLLLTALVLGPGALRARGAAELVDVNAGPLRVGIATADITPEAPVWMSGFSARKEPSKGVYRELTATCVVFDNGVTRLAFMALDLCKIMEPQLQDFRTAAGGAGVPPQNVMVNFSHSHYGPDLGHKKNTAYRALFKARTAPLFAAAAADLQPAVLDYTVGSCTMGINRRQLNASGKATGMRPEPRKQIDPDVPVLRALTAGGQVRLVLFGYACHPTTVNALDYKIGTDYPGYARDWIAAAYPGARPVFLQGCGGDIKPRHTKPGSNGYGRFGHVLLDQFQIVAELGHELGRAVVAALTAPPAPVPAQRPVQLTDAVAAPVQLGGIVEKVALPDKKEPATKSHAVYMGAWRVGDVYVFGSQCEICSNIGLRIKRELAGTRVWTNGYTHWGAGYIPDAASYPEGGYEVRTSCLAPAAEALVVNAAIRYVEALRAGKTGRGPIAGPPKQ